MWINLSKDDVIRICAALRMDARAVPESAEADLALEARLHKDAKDRLDPANRAWFEAAFREHHRDGEVEVDDQNDGSVMVSLSQEPGGEVLGAYVLAWVWVYADQLPKDTQQAKTETDDADA